MDNGCNIGVFGLATMGANLARNAARKGFRVALYNRHGERTAKLLERHGDEGDFVASDTVEAFIDSLQRPRAIILMVKAGEAVDAVIDELSPLLDPGDILIDAGNSLFSDTERRVGTTAAKGIRFVGMGVSGGELGALEGPSMMPGGDRAAYEHLAPILTKMAAQVDGEACCSYIGAGGAGHYVKMVHNGIEYADMQAIAEVYDILRSSYGLAAPAIAGVFDSWREGELSSYLLDITVDVLRRRDDQTGDSLVDLVVDEAEQKGTGRWTAMNAFELGVVGTSTAAAVDARVLSARRDLRLRAAHLLDGPEVTVRPFNTEAADTLYAGLVAARVVAFSQGFDQIAAASKENDWRLDLGAVAALWRGGCIIRARILDRILETRPGEGHRDPLVTQPWFRAILKQSQQGWRGTVCLAISDGVPTPVLSSALAYYDGLRRERAAANLIQGLRDEFGAHGYRRAGYDEPQHTDWTESGTDAQ